MPLHCRPVRRALLFVLRLAALALVGMVAFALVSVITQRPPGIANAIAAGVAAAAVYCWAIRARPHPWRRYEPFHLRSETSDPPPAA